MFSHLCASLQKTKNSDFRIPANINSGKSQFVCQIVIILFYKLNTISQINTCHKPLHAAASGPHAQNEYLKIKKKKLNKLLKFPIFSTHFWNMKSVKIKTIVPSTTVKWASTKWKHNLKEKKPCLFPQLKNMKISVVWPKGENSRDLKKKLDTR